MELNGFGRRRWHFPPLNLLHLIVLALSAASCSNAHCDQQVAVSPGRFAIFQRGELWSVKSIGMRAAVNQLRPTQMERVMRVVLMGWPKLVKALYMNLQ
jgi:hypothetical protein